MNSDPPVRDPPEDNEIDPDDVEELPDEDGEVIAEEITNPSIRNELLLAALGEQVDDDKVNPLTAIGTAARENPEAIDALLDGLRMPSLPPPPLPTEPPPAKVPTTLPAPPDEEDEDEEEAAFYAAISLPPGPPKPK